MFTRNLFRTAIQVQKTQSFTQFRKFAPAFSTQKFSEKLNSLKNKSEPQQNTATYEQSHADIVEQNVGLKKFLSKVYNTTGLGIGGALVSTQLAISSGLAFAGSPLAVTLGGFAATMVGLIGVQRMQPTHVEVNGIQTTQNSLGRTALFGLGMSGLGISASPYLAYVAYSNPYIIPVALGISASVFGAASLYAYRSKPSAISAWGSVLHTGLYSLLALQLVNLGAYCIMGPNMLSGVLSNVSTFGGVGLFSALVAYDTHTAIQQYEAGNADHMLIAIELGLDFWNIFMRMVRILQMFSSSD